eukprot:1196115-Prorocentrum_minimum.AAC.3
MPELQMPLLRYWRRVARVREAAAVRVQAAWRGVRARQQFAELQAMLRNMCLQAAAAAVQRRWRDTHLLTNLLLTYNKLVAYSLTDSPLEVRGAIQPMACREGAYTWIRAQWRVGRGNIPVLEAGTVHSVRHIRVEGIRVRPYFS